jgi:parallel beta-helix repeat protein
VRNYSGNGVTTSKTHHIILRDLIADHSGRYGFYPVESEDILIDNCVATGISDAGIYVGQSRRAIVQHCVVFKNVAGIEIENTVDSQVLYNEAYGNTAGLLAFVLPNNPSKIGQNCLMRYNNVHDNNLNNWGEPGAIVTKVPAGIGIAIMAADGTVVQENLITGNRSVGVAVIGLDLLVSDPNGIDVDPNPDATVLRSNNYMGNGKDPDKALKDNGFMTGGDILWDGKGKGSCLDEPQGDNLAKVGAAGAIPGCK